MELKFRCAHCDRKLEADATMSGTAIPCPNCGMELTIPAAHLGPGVNSAG